MTERGARPAADARAAGGGDGVNERGVRVEALWLATLQELTARVTHELRNALNGVAVNLEVLRARAQRPGLDAAALVPFAEAAGSQLETLTELTEALLALSRPARGAVIPGDVLRRLMTLLGPVAEREGGTFRLEAGAEGEEATTVEGDAVRLALGATLLASLRDQEGGALTCGVSAAERDDATAVRIARERGAAPEVPTDVAQAAAEAGIRLARSGHDVTFTFPAQPRRMPS